MGNVNADLLEARTPARASYQARRAVMMPSQPPICVMAVDADNAPIVRNKKVRVRKPNTAMVTNVVLSVAVNIKNVKIVQPRRKTPIAVPSVPVLTSAATIPDAGKRAKPRASQKPP